MVKLRLVSERDIISIIVDLGEFRDSKRISDQIQMHVCCAVKYNSNIGVLYLVELMCRELKAVALSRRTPVRTPGIAIECWKDSSNA